MNTGETEADAINRATLFVENMLQRPDQLQKVEQFKRRVQRKKLSVEAMLKTAMQSQLDGVRSGLNQLQNALSDLKEIKSGLADIEESLIRVPDLNNNLIPCREEYLKHSQYAAAMENLKHIFTVPESIEKTRQFIADGKLLNAHQCITDLENSRDDLLFELHKLAQQNPNETRLLKEYFAEVQTLSDDLGKQLWIILQRTFNAVRKEPTQIVTALRIIEREERADEYSANREKASGYLPIGRPKKWKKKAFDVFEKVVAQRIEGNQFDERETNKSWLIRYLEVIRMMLLEDFKVIKLQCIPCFPPHYNIMNTYVDLYHKHLSLHLVGLVEGGLQDNEHVTLLSWVLNTYASKDLMGHPSLGIDTNKLGSLLEDKVLDSLKKQYLDNVKANYESWMMKALELEEKEWVRPEPPHQGGEAFYKTELPHLLHDMMKQNLDVAATISQEIQAQTLITSIEEVTRFAVKFREAIVRYKDAYFADRSKIHFTTYMIAEGNSSQAIMDMMISVKEQFWRCGTFPHIDNQVAVKFERLKHTYEELRDKICTLLMEEALMDMQEQFMALLTTKWITDDEPMDTICLTLTDYFRDYNHLHPKNFVHIVNMALNNVGRRYITAILQRRNLSLRNEEDRKRVADRIVKDAESLESVFDSVAPDLIKGDNPCVAIKWLAEVIKVSDMDFLSLEIHRLLRRYPDINSDHLTALLMLRGDMNRLEVRQRVSDSIEEVKSQRTGPLPPKSIFSSIQIQSSIFS